MDLGTLGEGLTSSASDINELNQVVGSSWTLARLTSIYRPKDYHAFIWEENQMTDLNSKIFADSGWVLTGATAINDHGDIVGNGLKSGKEHGFVLLVAQ